MSEIKDRVNLVLSYFDAILGPKIVLSYPNIIPKSVDGTIKKIFDIDMENPYFEMVLMDVDLKITNLYFEIPSKWARGAKEMTMISVITGKDFNNQYFYDILKEVSEEIQNRQDMYKSLYKESTLKDGQSQSKAIEQKFRELNEIFVRSYENLKRKKKEIEIQELVASKRLSLIGASKVFGEILTDIISSLMQKKNVILCGDKDASASLLNILKQVFHDIFALEERITIKGKCEVLNQKDLVINTRLGIKECCFVSNEGHSALNRYLKEAEGKGDGEAAILYLRQRLSILLKVAELLEKVLKGKKNTKQIIRLVNSKMRVKLKVDELYAVRLILIANGNDKIAKFIATSKLDKF